MLRLLGYAACTAFGLAAGGLVRTLLIPADEICACGHHRCFHAMGRERCHHEEDARHRCGCVYMVAKTESRLDMRSVRANLRELAHVLAD